MSRFDDLKRKLKNREPVLSTTIANVAWSGLAQKIAAYSFDFVVLDEEHGTLSAESGEEILRVCRLCDLPAIVRVGNAVPNIIAKTLDMGADGIMIPRVETIEQIEIVVTSRPVTEETRDIINADTLGMMKRTGFLINVARGEIVEERALVEALNREIIAGASLDVTKQEPLPHDSPLWKAKNIFITPHRAAYGDQMFNKMNALIERNIHHYLKGEKLEDRIL